MILDSFDHAEEDFAKRLLIEARLEAEKILSLVDRAPGSPAWMQLAGEEQAEIGAARDHLASVNLGDDLADIREATLALDRATRRYADLQMDAAVSTAMRGKTMEAAGEDLGDELTAPHPMAPAEFK
jgi:molecular chaperone DnaK